MSTLLKIAAGILACLVVALVILRIVGFDPSERWPGLWLTGEVVETPVTDWTNIAKEVQEETADEVKGGQREAWEGGAAPEPGMIAVQTRHWWLPILPHSANYGWTVTEGQLYITGSYQAAQVFPDGRYFHRNLVNDPRARIRLAGKLYDGILEYVPQAERREIARKTGRDSNQTTPGGYSVAIRFISRPND